MYSKTELIGFVQSNPQTTVMSSNGALKCEFTVSTIKHFTNSKNEKKKHEELHIVQAWGSKAEILDDHVRKGMRIAVHGSNKTEQCVNGDGHPIQRTVVVLDEFNLLDRSSKPYYVEEED